MPSFGTSSFQNGTRAFNEQVVADEGGNIDVREMIRQMSGETIQTNFLGAPPPVLYLSAFSRMGATDGTGSVGHLRNIPVVVTQLSIPYPTDVDYIPTASNDGSGKDTTPMPTIMTIDMQLTETHSPREYERFNLQQFKTGDLSGF